jgi:hypothetical protein
MRGYIPQTLKESWQALVRPAMKPQIMCNCNPIGIDYVAKAIAPVFVSDMLALAMQSWMTGA